MRVIRGNNYFKFTGKSVIAIGVFDGVHKVHRLIVSSAVNYARRIGARIIVLTFWPHPHGQASLNSLNHRLRLLEDLGVDVCVVIRFNRKFARISAENFVKNILLKRLNARAIFIGDNFRFGKDSRGDAALLENLSRIYGFRLTVFKVIKTGRFPVSSTLIRGFISAGKLKEAEKLLLRPVSVLGTVIKGKSLAAELGFPTANIEADHEILPPAGIYAVRIILARRIYAGLCYIGKSPTFFRSNKKQSIEVHIFDFKKNIYGRDLEIQFLRRIRAEKKFAGYPELVKQIKKDIIKAKVISSAGQR